jgi:hypothetical protein
VAYLTLFCFENAIKIINTTQSTSKQEHSQDGLFIGDRKQEDRIAYLVSFVNSKENSRETSDTTNGEL